MTDEKRPDVPLGSPPPWLLPCDPRSICRSNSYRNHATSRLTLGPADQRLAKTIAQVHPRCRLELQPPPVGLARAKGRSIQRNRPENLPRPPSPPGFDGFFPFLDHLPLCPPVPVSPCPRVSLSPCLSALNSRRSASPRPPSPLLPCYGLASRNTISLWEPRRIGGPQMPVPVETFRKLPAFSCRPLRYG